MKPQLWEISLLDWSTKGLDDAVVGPEHVLPLLRAENDESATESYWRLDGLVCANGLTYAAALPVTQFILSAVPSSKDVVRQRCLELLGQIVGGESSSASGNVVEECRAELLQMAWYLLHGLQYDDVKSVWRYVDLISPLADAYPSFRRRAIPYLNLALTRDLSDMDRQLIINVLASYHDVS